MPAPAEPLNRVGPGKLPCLRNVAPNAAAGLVLPHTIQNISECADAEDQAQHHESGDRKYHSHRDTPSSLLRQKLCPAFPGQSQVLCRSPVKPCGCDM